MSHSKPAGKSQQKQVFEIVRLPGIFSSCEPSGVSQCSIIDQLQVERIRNEVLQVQIHHQLEMKVEELKQTQHVSVAAEDLSKQIDQVIQHGHQVLDRPNTIKHFYEFSLDSIIPEL